MATAMLHPGSLYCSGGESFREIKGADGCKKFVVVCLQSWNFAELSARARTSASTRATIFDRYHSVQVTDWYAYDRAPTASQ